MRLTRCSDGNRAAYLNGICIVAADNREYAGGHEMAETGAPRQVSDTAAGSDRHGSAVLSDLE
jgi:hypothetical protein